MVCVECLFCSAGRCEGPEAIVAADARMVCFTHTLDLFMFHGLGVSRTIHKDHCDIITFETKE